MVVKVWICSSKKGSRARSKARKIKMMVVVFEKAHQNGVSGTLYLDFIHCSLWGSRDSRTVLTKVLEASTNITGHNLVIRA